jgi:hypothetical protein
MRERGGRMKARECFCAGPLVRKAVSVSSRPQAGSIPQRGGRMSSTPSSRRGHDDRRASARQSSPCCRRQIRRGRGLSGTQRRRRSRKVGSRLVGGLRMSSRCQEGSHGTAVTVAIARESEICHRTGAVHLARRDMERVRDFTPAGAPPALARPGARLDVTGRSGLSQPSYPASSDRPAHQGEEAGEEEKDHLVERSTAHSRSIALRCRAR